MSRIPADLAISERSYKFYNGTYIWDSDGFTDEHGVYRKFDCSDPLARAPTPLPPMFSDDDDDEDTRQIATTGIKSAQLLDANMTELDLDTPRSEHNETAGNLTTLRKPTDIRRFAINFVAISKHNKAMHQVKPETACEKGNVISKVGSIGAAPERANTRVNPGLVPRLGTAPLSAAEVACKTKLPDTPPESPSKTVFGIQKKSPASASSALSPVPHSSLDQDEGSSRNKNASSALPPTTTRPSTPPKASSRTKTKTSTTRGVAQKVSKGSRKSPTNKFSPPASKGKRVEDCTSLELHAGAFMRGGGLRRSVRLAKPEGN